ncbi:hypothetical protein PMAYCL1PPCAC_27597, partial [Pristionchus mayeri]
SNFKIVLLFNIFIVFNYFCLIVNHWRNRSLKPNLHPNLHLGRSRLCWCGRVLRACIRIRIWSPLRRWYSCDTLLRRIHMHRIFHLQEKEKQRPKWPHSYIRC